jgi:hypothetical protein
LRWLAEILGRDSEPYERMAALLGEQRMAALLGEQRMAALLGERE